MRLPWLWEGLGGSLYDCLDNADHHTLAKVIGDDLADILLGGWRQYGKADALRWFQDVGLDLRLSRKIPDVYGGEALKAINADTYRLLAFGMSWPALDQLAQKHFGVALDVERRGPGYRRTDGRRVICVLSAHQKRFYILRGQQAHRVP